jgi:hypothetical protein
MALVPFAQIAANPQAYIAQLAADNYAIAESLAANFSTPIAHEMTVSLHSAAADAVTYAFCSADAAETAQHVFVVADILAVMRESQRVKLVSANADDDHQRVALLALGHIEGQLTASEVAAAVGIPVPPGRPQQHPRGAAKAEIRRLNRVLHAATPGSALSV